MRKHVGEMVDLALTQSIERYLEMHPTQIYSAILREWPEQIARLLVEFIFKTTCVRCGSEASFVGIKRAHGDCDYIAALCDCEWRDAP